MIERIHEICSERPIVPILVLFFTIFACVAVYEEFEAWIGRRQDKHEPEN